MLIESANLVTMDPRAEAALLATGNAADSIPWHFRDEAPGHAVSLDDHPGIWFDYRAITYMSGVDLLPDPYTTEGTGWVPDSAHTPSLNYLPSRSTHPRCPRSARSDPVFGSSLT